MGSIFGCSVDGNVFSGATDPLGASTAGIISNSGPNAVYGLSITGNSCSSNAKGGVNIANAAGAVIVGNAFYCSSVTINCNNVRFAGNAVMAYGVYALIVDGGARNWIEENTLDNSVSAGNFACARCINAGAANNIIRNNVLKKGTGGVYIDQQTSAAGNILGPNTIDTGSSITDGQGATTRGDVSATLDDSDTHTQIWASALTGTRTVTLNTANAWSGQTFLIVREAAATGAFNLNVGTGPLAALTPGSFCEVVFDGSTWALGGYGSLSALTLTVGTTAISGGATTRILYDNAGILGEYTLTGSGTVAVMQNTPTLTTPVIGAATGTSAVLTNQIWSGSVSTALSTLTGATDGFRSSAANVTGSASENTTSSSASAGAVVGMYSNDGAAMASGDRLGGIRMGGSSSASALRSSAGVFAFADQAWVDASAYGSRLEFQNTTNGAVALSTKAILSNAGLFALGATLANTVPGIKPSSTTLAVRLGDDSADAGLSAATLGLSGKATITQGTANTGVLASTGYSLTGSDQTNMIDLAGTWNTSGVPTAIKLNITNTASGIGSKLIDLQIGGNTCLAWVPAPAANAPNLILAPGTSANTPIDIGSAVATQAIRMYGGTSFSTGPCLQFWPTGSSFQGMYFDAGNATGANILFRSSPSGTVALTITQGVGNVVFGSAAIATNATDGFIYIPTCAGTPTGTPTGFTGRVPMVVDTSGVKIWFYIGGAWKGVVVS